MPKDDEGSEWKKETETLRAQLAELAGKLPNLETAPEVKALRDQLTAALAQLKELAERPQAENPQATAKLTALETKISDLSATLAEMAKSLPPKKDETLPAPDALPAAKTKRNWL